MHFWCVYSIYMHVKVCVHAKGWGGNAFNYSENRCDYGKSTCNLQSNGWTLSLNLFRTSLWSLMNSWASPFAQGGRTTSSSFSPLCLMPEWGGGRGGGEEVENYRRWMERKPEECTVLYSSMISTHVYIRIWHAVPIFQSYRHQLGRV